MPRSGEILSYLSERDADQVICLRRERDWERIYIGERIDWRLYFVHHHLHLPGYRGSLS